MPSVASDPALRPSRWHGPPRGHRTGGPRASRRRSRRNVPGDLVVLLDSERPRQHPPPKVLVALFAERPERGGVDPDQSGREQRKRGQAHHDHREQQDLGRCSTPKTSGGILHLDLADQRPSRGLTDRGCYHARALSGHPVGAWRSLVARIVRDDKVVGSNPAAPTILLSSAASDPALRRRRRDGPPERHRTGT